MSRMGIFAKDSYGNGQGTYRMCQLTRVPLVPVDIYFWLNCTATCSVAMLVL